MRRALVSLEYPNIVNHHPLRESCGSIRASRPVAAYCHIDQQEEWFIERIVIATQVSLSHVGDNLIVDHELHPVRFPYKAVQVEVVAVGYCGCFASADLYAAGSGSVMYCGIYFGGFMTKQFHDIHFAALGPAYRTDIAA